MIRQKLKTLARATTPRFRDLAKSVLNPRGYMESAFTPFYKENCWGDSESVSGPGSSLDRTAKLRSELPALLEQIGAHSLLDAPCGDFNWMKETALSINNYIGLDIIPELITRNEKLYGNDQRQFILSELTTDHLPSVDVILCRDCFIHFSYRDIRAALRNFKRSGSRYLLTNTYPLWQKNVNIRTGGFRHINLTLPPFNFPPSLFQIDEKHPDEQEQFFGKTLELWQLTDL